MQRVMLLKPPVAAFLPVCNRVWARRHYSIVSLEDICGATRSAVSGCAMVVGTYFTLKGIPVTDFQEVSIDAAAAGSSFFLAVSNTIVNTRDNAGLVLAGRATSFFLLFSIYGYSAMAFGALLHQDPLCIISLVQAATATTTVYKTALVINEGQDKP